MLYIFPVALTVLAAGRWTAWLNGMFTICLVFAGYLLSPPGELATLAPLNRLLISLQLAASVVMIELFKRYLATVRRIETDKVLLANNQDQIIESSPSGMLIINQSGTILLVNAKVEQLFGYRREELLGQPVEQLIPERFRPQHPSQRSAFFRNPTIRAMGAGRNLLGRRKDGTEFPVELGLNPMETPNGLRVLASIVDITARKRAEQLS